MAGVGPFGRPETLGAHARMVVTEMDRVSFSFLSNFGHVFISVFCLFYKLKGNLF